MSKSKKQVLGYLTLFKMVDVDIYHDTLEEIASGVGFPEEFVPSPPKKRGAWEKATNLGKKGLVIDPPEYLSDRIAREYDVRPTLRLHTEIIRRSAPKLVRHIVRTVTVPTTRNESDKRFLADVQYQPLTVAIMEFDCNENSYKTMGYSDGLQDMQGWVRDDLRDVVKDLHERVDKAINHADGQTVRDGIRDYLKSKKSTLVSSGGAYYIPFEEGLEQELMSLKSYVELLGDYAVKRNEDGTPFERPSVKVIALTEDNDGFDLTQDIAEEATVEFKRQIESLLEELTPILDGGRTEKVAENTKKRVRAEYSEISEAVIKYRVLLKDSLSGLNEIMSKAQEIFDAVNEVNTFRPIKSKRGEIEQVQIETEDSSVEERPIRGLPDADQVIISADDFERQDRSL